MKVQLPATHAILACLPLLALSSCGTMKVVTAAKDKTTAAMGKTSAAMGQLADASVGRFMGPKVPVVEVREKDLKEMPTGEERALAFESKKKRNFWFFGGPVDFKEPALPASGGELDGSLLPPIE